MGNNIPLRACFITKERLPKNELLRIIKNKDNQIIIDLSQKQNGHGVYIKKDIEVINKLKKSKRLNSIFEVDINENLYEELIKSIN